VEEVSFNTEVVAFPFSYSNQVPDSNKTTPGALFDPAFHISIMPCTVTQILAGARNELILNVYPSIDPSTFDVQPNAKIPVAHNGGNALAADNYPKMLEHQEADRDRLATVSQQIQNQLSVLRATRDFRMVVRDIERYELITANDLTRITGASRQTINTWKKTTLNKTRAELSLRLEKTFFAWKYWVFLGSGQPLGAWLRVTTDYGTLIDALKANKSEEQIVEIIEALMPIAGNNFEVALDYRRYRAGLPGSFTLETI
jgi:hypothetical protein